ncbi:MAG: M1 family metallopeptidase [bacterium]|nr:M1 family metallopeptidase [bacterium]
MRHSACLRRILLLLSITVCGSRLIGQEPDTLRLDRGVIPALQTVRLSLDPSRTDYSGSVEITLAVHARTSSFRLHAKGLKIRDLELRDKDGKIPCQWTAGPEGLLRVRPRRPLEPGFGELRVDFEGSCGKNGLGLYRSESGGKAYLATQFEPAYARSAFPCWDEPGFKNPFRVILTVPSGLACFSNEPAETLTVRGKMKTVAFMESRPLPAYAVAFAVGPFETVPLPGLSVPGSVIVPSGRSSDAAEAARRTPPILAALEKWFGPYPYRKLDLIAVPDMGGAMENPGLVTFNPNTLLMDPDASSLDQRRSCSAVIAHELAHMWFGDLVTAAWWDDTWLNESFATWIGNDVTERVFPEFRSFSGDIQSVQWTMGSDALPSISPIRRTVRADEDPWHVFDELSYIKGGAVLAMVDSWAGREYFQEGLVDYLASHRHMSADAADLWQSLSRSTGGDVDSMTATFIDQPGLPLVRVGILADGRVRLTQNRFLNAGFDAPPQTWRIPMALRCSDGRNTVLVKRVLRKEADTVAVAGIESPEWILPNADERSYFRWIVPDSMLLRMSRDAVRIMNVRERIGFLGNASGLLDGGALGGDEYLEILRSFASDPEPEVIRAVLSGIRKAGDLFSGEPANPDFTAYVRGVLNPVLGRIGRQRRPGETPTLAVLRSDLLSVLTELGGDPRALAFCDSLAAGYLADPGTVDPDLADDALRASAMNGNEALFRRYVTALEGASSPDIRARFMSLLGAFRKPDILALSLDYGLKSSGDRQQALWRIPFRASGFMENRPALMEWVFRNADAIRDKAGPMILDYLIPGLVQVRSDSLVQKAVAWAADPSNKSRLLDIELRKEGDRLATRLRLIERETPAVEAYLRRFGE